MKTLEIIGSLMILSGLFIAYHMYIAPEVNENGKVIKPGKKLIDLFKRKR